MTLVLLTAHGVLATSLVVASVLAVRARSPEAMRWWTGVILPLVLLQTVFGDVLYPIYIRNAKPTLRALEAGSRSVADVFEVKEHVAFLVLALTVGAFLAARGSSRPLARLLLVGAHAGIILVATLGLVVASMRTP